MSDPTEDPLLPIVVAFLAPFFFPFTKDVARAQQAAIATIQNIQGNAKTDLINIAQIIAFGLAALNTLGLTMDETIDPELLIRLNTSATALSRCEDRNRRFLKNRPTRKPAPKPITPEEDAAITAEAEKQLGIAKGLQATVREIVASQKNSGQKPSDAVKKGYITDAKNLDWVFSYAGMAQECIMDPETYAWGCRKEANLRARLLNTCAYDVLCGKPADLSALTGFNPDKITRRSQER